MTDTIIRIDTVTRRFGPVVALDGVNFNIKQGEFFSLLGASGCGKTTLLRIIAGIDQPSFGDIYIDGENMTNVPSNRRPTNMVFQNYAVFPHLNVRENIGYGLVYHKISKAEAAKRVDEALDLVKLTGLGDRATHQLSGGQRQRVALARALVCRPKVLLLDEPLSALDKNLREEMQHELRVLQRHVGITFVFVTHDQEESLTLSDRIAVMEDGRVLQIDTPKGLYDSPKNRSVASFVGTMNLFPGTITSVDGGEALVDAGIIGRLAGTIVEGEVASGEAAYIALRPERITIDASDSGGAGVSSPTLNRIAGVVESITYLGDRSRCLVAVPGLDQPVSVVYVNAEQDSALNPGQAVHLTWSTQSARVMASLPQN